MIQFSILSYIMRCPEIVIPKREIVARTDSINRKPRVQKLGDISVETSKPNFREQARKATDAAGWHGCPESNGFCD